MAVGWKYLVFLALVLPAAAGLGPAVSVGLLTASVIVVATTGAPLRLAWGLPAGLIGLLVLLGGYHVATGNWPLAVTIVCALLVAVYASRLLLLTTPTPVLIDALVSATRPLRPLGVDPERFGLAVAIMIRSIPFIASAFGEVRAAARARGLERNFFAQIAPVVVQTVAYARTTGEALAARGLGETSA